MGEVCVKTKPCGCVRSTLGKLTGYSPGAPRGGQRIFASQNVLGPSALTKRNEILNFLLPEKPPPTMSRQRFCKSNFAMRTCAHTPQCPTAATAMAAIAAHAFCKGHSARGVLCQRQCPGLLPLLIAPPYPLCRAHMLCLALRIEHGGIRCHPHLPDFV